MNDSLVASVLYMVFLIDLSKLREVVRELPDMPLEELYEELLIKFPHCIIHDKDVQIFQSIHQWFPEETHIWVEDLDVFDVNDIMLFFLAISWLHQRRTSRTESDIDLKDYTYAPFNKLVTTGIPSNYVEDVLADIRSYVQFDESGELVVFESELDVKSFILYHALIADAVEPDAPKRTFCAQSFFTTPQEKLTHQHNFYT
jgi:hypothetical protein